MMKKKVLSWLLIAVLATALPSTVYASTPGMMAVTFPSTSGWTVSGTAGAPGYAQAHWVNTNSWQSSWGNQYSLVDNSGTATGATMDWYASGIYSWTFGAAANDDERMMDAGIASGDAGLVEIHVIDIPYETYDVVVYFTSQLTYPFVSKYTIGSTSVYGQVGAMGYFGNDDTYVEVPLTSTADLQANTPAGNYIVFKNITGSTLYLTAQGGWAGLDIYNYSQGNPRASISGFQIIDAGPVPPKYEEAMAITFPSTSGWTVSGTAGAPGYAQAHWVNTNSWQSSWGNQYSLVDNNDQLTGATMDWYASGVYSWTFGAATNDNERMMDCGIASGGEGLVEVHVIDIPYESYDVAVYFSSQLTHSFVSKYTIGTTSVYARVPAMGYFANDNTFTQVPLSSTTDLQGNTPAGNYIIFKNITGSTLYITAQPGWAGNSIYNGEPGQPYASISGFQIINTCNGRPDSDLNGDCAVDIWDLKIVADNWLAYVDEFSDVRSGCAKNPLIYAPQISAITVNGDFSDWTSASDWAVFGKWNAGGNDGTTQSRYAWNDAANKLYIGIETTESSLLYLEVGGLMGDLSDPCALPSGGIQATQIAFYGWTPGLPPTIYNQNDGTTSGIQAAWSSSGGVIRIEIATPIYSNWNNNTTGMNLTTGMDIYEYADIFGDEELPQGDNQCANGEYVYTYGSPVMLRGSLVRLVQSLPRTCGDIPSIYKNGPLDFNNDCIVNFQDFTVIALDWLQDF